MASKIETSLTPEQLHEFFKRCAQLKGTKLKDIQALAEEFGIDVSLMSARTFRKGALKDYLDELVSARKLAEDVTAVAKDASGMSDAAARVFSTKVLDRALSITADEIGTEEGNNVSLAIARLKAGDRQDKKLEADLKLRDEQVARLERERIDWEEKRQKITEQLALVKNAPAVSADAVRAAAVAEIDRIMGIKTKT